MRLGKELRRLREVAGVTRPEAAAAIGCSPGKIGHIELGKYAPSKSDLIVLLRDHYEVDQETREALEELRAEASKRGWWSTFSLPEWLAAYVGLEYDAISMRTVETLLIPGLLQTEDYARELHKLDPRLSAKEVERRVSARMQRQERLAARDPLMLSVVLDEAALLRCSRHRSVATGQLRHLMTQALLPSVELRVLPLDLGLHVGMAGSFSVLSFPDELLSDVGAQEYPVGGHLVDSRSAVEQMVRLYDELRSQALGPNESLAVIAELVDRNQL